MVVILLSPLLCKSDSLILRLHEKKVDTLMKHCFLQGDPGVTNNH